VLNRAARLLPLAAGGVTVLSQSAAELVRDRLPPELALVDIGRHELRGLSRSERVFELRASASASGGAPSVASGPIMLSLARSLHAPPDCEKLAHDALAHRYEGYDEAAVRIFAVQMLVVRRQQGRLDEIVETIEGFAERSPELPGWRCGLAHMYSQLDRGAQARHDSRRSRTPTSAIFRVTRSDWWASRRSPRSRPSSVTITAHSCCTSCCCHTPIAAWPASRSSARLGVASARTARDDAVGLRRRGAAFRGSP
jgi:hypothetical protein